MHAALPAVLLVAAAAVAAPPPAMPPQTPLAGAPTGACSFDRIDGSTPIRITVAGKAIPYQFACGVNRPAGVCAVNSLPSGLIVNLGPQQNGWACVTGGDSTTGWVPTQDLATVPATPRVPMSEWLGWWRMGEDVKGVKNNRLLITRRPGSDLLHVSGRAYWYGSNDNVHFGAVQADAAPVGIYLHLVEPSAGVGCVVDLKLDRVRHTLASYDNEQCGGMNVRFGGTWSHFTPLSSSEAARAVTR